MRSCSLVLAWVALSVPAAALADPARAALSWVRGDGADACPDARALRAAVARHLGYDPTLAPEAAVSLEAVVTRAAPALPWSVALFARAPDGALLGERHLEVRADTCAPAVDAAALAIATTLDGAALATAPPPPPAPPPPAPPAPPSVAPRRRPAARPRRWGVAATALGGLSLGAIPALSPVAALVVELRPPRWPTVVVTGLYQPGASVELPLGRAVVALALVGLAVCPWRGARGALSLSLCAGALGGALVAAGQGFSIDRIRERAFVALEAGARARWSLGRYVHLAADAHAVAPLVRDTLVVGGVGEVGRVAPVGLRTTIGLGLHFE